MENTEVSSLAALGKKSFQVIRREPPHLYRVLRLWDPRTVSSLKFFFKITTWRMHSVVLHLGARRLRKAGRQRGTCSLAGEGPSGTDVGLRVGLGPGR